jgi:hypothetical protein
MMGKKIFWNKSVMKYQALNLGQIRDGECFIRGQVKFAREDVWLKRGLPLKKFVLCRKGKMH